MGASCPSKREERHDRDERAAGSRGRTFMGGGRLVFCFTDEGLSGPIVCELASHIDVRPTIPLMFRGTSASFCMKMGPICPIGVGFGRVSGWYGPVHAPKHGRLSSNIYHPHRNYYRPIFCFGQLFKIM